MLDVWKTGSPEIAIYDRPLVVPDRPKQIGRLTVGFVARAQGIGDSDSFMGIVPTTRESVARVRRSLREKFGVSQVQYPRRELLKTAGHDGQRQVYDAQDLKHLSHFPIEFIKGNIKIAFHAAYPVDMGGGKYPEEAIVLPHARLALGALWSVPNKKKFMKMVGNEGLLLLKELSNENGRLVAMGGLLPHHVAVDLGIARFSGSQGLYRIGADDAQAAIEMSKLTQIGGVVVYN